MLSPDTQYGVLVKAGMSFLEEIYMSLIPLAGPGYRKHLREGIGASTPLLAERGTSYGQQRYEGTLYLDRLRGSGDCVTLFGFAKRG